MKKFSIVLVAFASVGFLHAEEKELKDVKGMVCPVKATDGCDGSYCSKEVKLDIHAEHEGRKVYFCCDSCVKDFKKDPKSYLEKTKEQWKVIDEKE